MRTIMKYWIVSVLLTVNALVGMYPGYEEKTLLESPLITAARNNDLPEVKRLLALGINIEDNWHRDGCTALHVAVNWGWLEIADCLLQHSADIEARENHGFMPIISAVAAEEHSIECLDLLFQRGAKIDAKDNDGWTALSCASHWGKKNAVVWLIEHGADVHEKSGKFESTPFFKAVMHNHLAIMKILYQHKVDINAPSNDGTTPLMQACFKGDMNTVKLLLELKADIHFLDKNGKTAFFIALENKHFDIAELLLQQGAKVYIAPGIEYISPKNGNPTALMDIVRQGGTRSRFIDFWLRNKIDDIDAQAGDEKYTALMCAVSHNRDDYAKLLLKHGADITKKDFEKYDVLRWAPLFDMQCSHVFARVCDLSVLNKWYMMKAPQNAPQVPFYAPAMQALINVLRTTYKIEDIKRLLRKELVNMAEIVFESKFNTKFLRYIMRSILPLLYNDEFETIVHQESLEWVFAVTKNYEMLQLFANHVPFKQLELMHDFVKEHNNKKFDQALFELEKLTNFERQKHKIFALVSQLHDVNVKCI